VRCFCSAGYPSVKRGAQCLEDDSCGKSARQTECSAYPGRSCRSQFLSCRVRVKIEVGVCFSSIGPVLFSMCAPILLIAFALASVCITFACKEPHAKS
jgi:hypothetical protein